MSAPSRHPHAFYWSVQPWLAPGLQNSHVAYARALQRLVPRAGSWLDIGCGHGFVPDWTGVELTPAAGMRIVGIDMDPDAIRRHPHLTNRVLANGQALPFGAGTFDLVTTNMVLEHVELPASLFAEVSRVLKPGGIFLAHTPNGIGYTTGLTRLVPERLRARLASVLQDRREEDVYPTFYRSNTARQLHRLCRTVDLEPASIEYIESSPLFVKWPVVLIAELLFIRLVRISRLQELKACLLARILKPSAPPLGGGIE